MEPKSKKNLKRFISGDMKNMETDLYLKTLLEDKFRHRLRESYAQELRDKHDVYKGKHQTKTFNLRFVMRMAAVITGLVLTGSLFYMYGPAQSGSNMQLANHYFEQYPLEYVSNTRGEIEDQNQAFSLFADQNYDEAIQVWSSNDERLLTTEEKLYYAYSLIRASKHDEAARILSSELSRMTESDDWYQEMKFYEMLNLASQDKMDAAMIKYNELASGSWAKKEFAKAFKLKK